MNSPKKEKSEKSKVNTRTVNNTWTPSEDEKLADLVKKIPEGTPARWSKIAEALVTKTASQSFQHWQRVANPEIKRGIWMVEEEEKLHELVQKYGEKWSNVARYLPGRTGTSLSYYKHNLILHFSRYPSTL